MRCDGLACRPHCISANVKRIDAAIGRDVPSLGEAGEWSRVRFVVTREPFKNRECDPSVSLTRDNRRVERLRFRAVDDHEVGALVARATRERQRERRESPQKAKRPPTVSKGVAKAVHPIAIFSLPEPSLHSSWAAGPCPSPVEELQD